MTTTSASWPPDLSETLALAGFSAAHALWSVEDCDVLIPFVAEEFPSGQRNLLRFQDDDNIKAVARARTHLAAHASGASRAVLLFDGYITLSDGKTDGLFIETHVVGPLASSLHVVVPYRNAAAPGGLAVFRPKFLSLPPGAPDAAALAQAFFSGVDQHEAGAAFWNQHLDQSR